MNFDELLESEAENRCTLEQVQAEVDAFDPQAIHKLYDVLDMNLAYLGKLNLDNLPLLFFGQTILRMNQLIDHLPKRHLTPKVLNRLTKSDPRFLRNIRNRLTRPDLKDNIPEQVRIIRDALEGIEVHSGNKDYEDGASQLHLYIHLELAILIYHQPGFREKPASNDFLDNLTQLIEHAQRLDVNADILLTYLEEQQAKDLANKPSRHKNNINDCSI